MVFMTKAILGQVSKDLDRHNVAARVSLQRAQHTKVGVFLQLGAAIGHAGLGLRPGFWHATAMLSTVSSAAGCLREANVLYEL